MGIRWFHLALLLGLGIGLSAVTNGAAGADDDRIAKLVKQLSSKRFTERNRAWKELESLGTTALDALREASKSTDLETSRRAGELVKKMEEKIARDQILAPKRVRLNLKDTPVPQAVAELSKQSGYPIALVGDQTALAKRTITLDTGDTTFWQALDQLCEKAGLVENTGNVQPVPPYGRPVPLPQPVPPIRIQPAPPVQIQPLPAPVPPAVRPGVRIQVLPAQGAVQIQGNVKVQAIQIAVPAQGQAQAGQGQALPGVKVAPAVQPPPAIQPPPPVQIQIQPVQPLQVQPAIARRVMPIRPGFNPNQINLIAGKRVETPTSYSGAVRVRVAPMAVTAPNQPAFPNQAIPAGAKRDGEVLIPLEVSAEPRLQNFQLHGNVHIEKALDDQGQKLSVPMEPMPGGNAGVVGPGGRGIARPYIYNPYNRFNRYTYVRLKLGEKKAKTLKELSGHISAQTLSAPEALVTVDDVLKAGGKKFKDKSGAAIEVLSIEKQQDGSYKVQFRQEVPSNTILAPFQGPMAPVGQVPVNGPGIAVPPQIKGGVQIKGGAQIRPRPVRPVLRPVYINAHGLPTLVDAKGRNYQLTQVPQRMYRGGIGVATQEVTMIFRAHDGQGDPARLVLHGQRNITVEIPFTLHNVTLP